MGPAYELPPEIAALNANYGEEAKQSGGVANLHLEMLGPAVQELHTMEVQSQNLFLNFQLHFS